LSRIQIVLDGKDIYPMGNREELVIHVDHNNPVLVVTDGYHISRPLELVYHHLNTYYFRVECGMDDGQLIIAAIIAGFFTMMGLVTHLVIYPIIAMLPVIYTMVQYYIRKKDFLNLRPM
jgi:hypothetical protein